jgi:hypothetical protein
MIFVLQQSLNVTREHVDLKVDPLADLAGPRVVTAGCGNDVHAEAIAVDLVHRERDAVDGDRALGGDEARQIGRRLEDEAHAAALRRHRDDRAHAIDMAVDQMAAQLVAELERQFEVDAAALLPVAEMGLGQASRRGLDGEPIGPFSTTVRQQPEQAIEAPMATGAMSCLVRTRSGGRRCCRRRTAVISPMSVTMPVNMPLLSRSCQVSTASPAKRPAGNQPEPGREIQLFEPQGRHRRAAVRAQQQPCLVRRSRGRPGRPSGRPPRPRRRLRSARGSAALAERAAPPRDIDAALRMRTQPRSPRRLCLQGLARRRRRRARAEQPTGVLSAVERELRACGMRAFESSTIRTGE